MQALLPPALTQEDTAAVLEHCSVMQPSGELQMLLCRTFVQVRLRPPVCIALSFAVCVLVSSSWTGFWEGKLVSSAVTPFGSVDRHLAVQLHHAASAVDGWHVCACVASVQWPHACCVTACLTCRLVIVPCRILASYLHNAWAYI